MAYEEQVAQYYEDGYFIADDAFDPGMLAPLEAAARRAVAKVQSGEVVAKTEGISTGGPGDDTRDILGLIAPEFGEPLFAEYLGCKAIERYMHALLGPDLRLGWVAIFSIPGPEAYETGWHRDFSYEERDGSETVEMEILGRHRQGVVKWHMALVGDACLWLVPGSQKRYRTAEEREALINGHFVELSDAVQVVLKKGQTVFWNGNTIHRGRASEGMPERLAIMGALSQHRDSDRPQQVEERFGWRMADNIRDGLPEKTRLYYDRWRSLQQD